MGFMQMTHCLNKVHAVCGVFRLWESVFKIKNERMKRDGTFLRGIYSIGWLLRYQQSLSLYWLKHDCHIRSL